MQHGSVFVLFKVTSRRRNFDAHVVRRLTLGSTLKKIGARFRILAGNARVPAARVALSRFKLVFSRRRVERVRVVRPPKRVPVTAQGRQEQTEEHARDERTTHGRARSSRRHVTSFSRFARRNEKHASPTVVSFPLS